MEAAWAGYSEAHMRIKKTILGNLRKVSSAKIGGLFDDALPLLLHMEYFDQNTFRIPAWEGYGHSLFARIITKVA